MLIAGGHVTSHLFLLTTSLLGNLNTPSLRHFATRLPLYGRLSARSNFIVLLRSLR